MSMSKPLFTERLSFGMTPDMDRYLEELARTRTRQGKPTNKSDLLREAVRLYLDQQADLNGSRKQIAKSLEGRLEALAAQVAALNQHVEALQQQVRAERQEISSFRQALQPLVTWVESRLRTPGR
jgi:Arc/MetJ-type ribon-helix-helix transcriptional regulator